MNGLRQAQARAAWAARAVRILVLASMLSGCSWFGGGSKPEASDQSASFPNLGTVPTKTPTTPSNAERQQIAQGLIADQQNAAYTADQLTARANAGSVPAPEAPPPTSASASDGETTTTAASAAETRAKPAEATQNQAPSAAAATNAASPQTTAPATSTETAPKPAADTASAGSSVSPPTPSFETPTVQQPAASANSPEAASTSTQPAAPSDAAASEATNAQPSSGMPPTSLDLSPPVAIAPPPSVSATSAGESEAAAGSAAPASPQPFTMASLAPANGPEAIVGSGRPVAIIFFADGSAGLSERDLSVLRDVLLVQKQHGGHLRLVGHASGSPDSSDEARRKLDSDISLARAKAVSHALVKLGAPGDAIAVSAVGAKEPMFAETAPTGEAGNRRVEIFLDR